jgi:hypothetical protein
MTKSESEESAERPRSATGGGQRSATKPREASVRGTALRIGVDPRESECDDLVDELLLQGGYLENLPQPDP